MVFTKELGGGVKFCYFYSVVDAVEVVEAVVANSEDSALEVGEFTQHFFLRIYRVTKVVKDMGWVDFDFRCSTVGPIGQMRIWKNKLGTKATWWNIPLKVNLLMSRTTLSLSKD